LDRGGMLLARYSEHHVTVEHTGRPIAATAIRLAELLQKIGPEIGYTLTHPDKMARWLKSMEHSAKTAPATEEEAIDAHYTVVAEEPREDFTGLEDLLA